MRQAAHDRLISFQSSFEGKIEWMYLDSLSKVTVGIGKLIDSPDAAVKLGGWVHKSDGSPAVELEIRAEWELVKASGTAGHYKQLEDKTNLRLPTGYIDQIAFS